MTSRSLTVLLVIVLALAGCTAGPGTPTDDGQPAENAATGTPQGVVDGQLANASALVEAHETALAESGFAATVTYAENGSEVGSYDLVAAPDLTTYTAAGTRSTGEDSTVETHLWANETHRFVMYRSGDERSYHARLRGSESLDPIESVGSYLHAGDFTVADEPTAEGYTVLTADGLDPSGDEHGRLLDAESFSGRAVVDEAGRVRNLSVTVERERGSETFAFELRRTDVERVDRPDWLSEIPDGATISPQLSVDVRDETALVVRNEAGDAVPPNATLTLTTNDTTYRTTFDAPLGSGERRFAYISANDGELLLATEEPAAADAMELTSPISVTIETAGGVQLYSAGMGWGSASASESDGESGASSGSESDGGSSTSGGSAAGSSS